MNHKTQDGDGEKIDGGETEKVNKVGSLGEHSFLSVN